MRILFSSDNHGNDGQYARVLSHAARHDIEAVIFGGDIAPKGLSNNHYVKGQRLWYQSLASHLSLYQKAHPKGKVLMMMGNDDARANEQEFLKVLADNGALALHDERHSFADVDIVGYSFVPVTPFGMKDWELCDTNARSDRVTALQKQRFSTLRYSGWVTHENEWREMRLIQARKASRTIQDDLRSPVFLNNPERTVYAMHSPPVATALDRIDQGHVGSVAIRMFIEDAQPLITLHGHIHETVDISEKFMERIGNSACYASGNDDRTFGVAAILVDTQMPFDGKRLIL